MGPTHSKVCTLSVHLLYSDSVLFQGNESLHQCTKKGCVNKLACWFPSPPPSKEQEKKWARGRLWHWLFTIFSRLWQGTHIPFQANQKLQQTGIVIVYPFSHSALHLGLFHLCLSTRWESSAAPKWRNQGKMEEVWDILNPFVLFICQRLQAESSPRSSFSCFYKRKVMLTCWEKS